MAAKPVKIAYVADTSELRSSLAKAEAAMDDAAATAKTAGQKIDTALDSTAESADGVASKGSQAAGALSGLGDLVGGKWGAAMMTGGVAMQAFADAGDLVNVVTESNIIRKTKDMAVTVAKTAVEKTAAAASKAWAAAQWLLNAAMSANPIGLVAVAIAGLVAGLVIAYKKSETFRAIVTGAFDKVKSAVSTVVGWVKKNWPLLLAILTGPIGLAVLAITKNWDKIKAGAGAVKDWIVDKFHGLVGFFTGLPDRIGKATSGMFNGIKNAFKAALNWLIDKWNGLSFSIPAIDTHLPGVGKIGGFTLSTPDIPRLARGGITTGPTTALIGDNPGGREAVIPLDRYDLLGSGEIVTVLGRILTALEDSHVTIGRVVADEARRGWTEAKQLQRSRSTAMGGWA